MSVAIRFDHVRKSYKLTSGRQLLRNQVFGWLRGPSLHEFPVLKDLSFTIQQGESVAVLGHNGAGKSTLLSVVAGLSQPESGTMEVNGRVAALLELGSGFHPDLTGRENIHLNASLLGMSKRRTEELYDQIVDFSGIGEFIEQSLRTYSTGMTMRLAFAVAVNVDPDVLILDEVFAVGDQDFAVKCHDKMAQFRRSGKTMLCVSHSTATLMQFCERGLWLDHGQLVMDGDIQSVVEAYQTGVRPTAALTSP